jgi:hypothetical protein
MREHQVALRVAPVEYVCLQRFLDEFGFESPLDSDQQGDDALVPHGVCCSSQCHVPYKFQTREPSVQEPQPAFPGAGHSCAKDDSARYKEAGCEEGNERAQMIGKVHELLQPAEQPLTSGRHVT